MTTMCQRQGLVVEGRLPLSPSFPVGVLQSPLCAGPNLDISFLLPTNKSYRSMYGWDCAYVRDQ